MEQGWAELGEAIRARRQAAGLSQERLAELSGSHFTYISEIETNKVNPSVNVVHRIAAALGVRLSELVRDAGQLQDLSDALINREFAHRRNWTGEAAFIFHDEALAWYREQTAPSDHDVHQAIGRHLYRHFQEHEKPQPFDFDGVGGMAGTPLPRIKAHLKVLKAAGLVEDRTEYALSSTDLDTGITRPLGENGEPTYALTEPQGILWAASGFSMVGTMGTPIVNVTVINVQHFLEDVDRLNVSEDLKEAAKEVALELKKQPKLETLSKLFQIGGGATAMAGPVGRLIVENAPVVQQLAEAALRSAR